MQNIEIKLLAPDGVDKEAPEAKDNSLTVEIHREKPGIGPVVLKTENLSGKDEARSFKIPDDAFLVVKTKQASEELVFDRENSAAVRASTQRNTKGVADAADQKEVERLQERDRQQAAEKARAEGSSAPQRDNRQQDSGGPVTVEGKQQTPPIASNPAGQRQSGPGNAGPGPAGPTTVGGANKPPQGSEKK